MGVERRYEVSSQLNREIVQNFSSLLFTSLIYFLILFAGDSIGEALVDAE
jgi:hypothetical protein